MDKVSIFVDHYVIYDIARNIFNLNTNSGSQFEEALRTLIDGEVEDRIKAIIAAVEESKKEDDNGHQ